MARSAKWITAQHDLGHRLSRSKTNSPRPSNNLRRDRALHENSRRRPRSRLRHGRDSARPRHPLAQSSRRRRQANNPRTLRIATTQNVGKRRRRNQRRPHKLQKIRLETQASEAAKNVGPALYAGTLHAQSSQDRRVYGKKIVGPSTLSAPRQGPGSTS